MFICQYNYASMIMQQKQAPIASLVDVLVRTRPVWGPCQVYLVKDLQLIVPRKWMETLQWA